MRKFTIFLALLFFVGVEGLLAQTRVITGTVTSSEDKQPIPGVTVVVKGTTIGVNTNQDGKFVFSVPTKYDLLVFSYVGMKMKEVNIGTQSILDIVMDPDVLNMDEIVVTAIGVPRETKALSYSVQNVGSDEITKSARTDVINSMQGKVSDVQIINSAGVAGASSYIQIRGAQSITGNNQPLFVLDGVPISNSGGLNTVDGVAMSNRAIDINPDDIESISVLKGGAATALYGLQAASGAVIITSKKGKSTPGRKISVNFNTYIQFDQVSQLPELQTKYGQGTKGKWASGGRTSWGPRLDTCSYSLAGWDTYAWKEYDVDGKIVSKNDPNATGASIRTYDPYDFFETGLTTNNSLSIAGGGEVSTFYFSFSDNQSKGVIPNNKFRRNTFKISGDTKLGDKFKIAGSANYMITAGDRIQQGSNTSGVMLGLLRTPPTFDNSAGYITTTGAQRSYRHGTGYDNPYWTANMNKYNDQVNRLIGNVQLDYFTTKWLSFTYRVGIDWWGRKAKDILAVGSNAQASGWVHESMENNKDFNSDLMMTIDKDFGKDINLKVILGHNMQQHYYYLLNGNANDVVIPEYYNLNNSTAISSTEQTNKIRRAGLYGDVEVSWKNMLYLSVTGRNDWSTTLPQGKNSFFYPSVGLGWIFTQLPGLKDNKVLPYGKVRVSYAVVAKDAPAYVTSNYFLQPFLTDGWLNPAGIIFPWPGNIGYTASDILGNPDLKPEKTNTFEVGTDLKFINNRIGFSYTYFNNKGKDLILQVPIAASSGYLYQYMNAASMTTYGHEITLDIVPIKSKNWEWDITANWSLIRNEVLELAPGLNSLFLNGFTNSEVRATVGQPYRTFWGRDWKRNSAGQLLLTDDGYPQMNPDMVALGNIDPDWTAGIGSNLRWRDLSLYVLFDIKVGGKMWNGTRGALDYFGTSEGTANRDVPYLYEGIIESTGLANTKTVLQNEAWMAGDGSGFNGPNVDYLEDAGWVRLRTVTISYSFTKMLKKSFIKGLDVYATGTNLWLSTKYTGIDPETNLTGSDNAQGIDYFNMPGTRSYTVGLTLAF
ncbi:MAG: SusC/RagA family TonB-linked outer membrane protein [Bacteroidetes bacterium]|nr:SusC/RagA family TonB-linked outer membrane protein [Bacteroidota bacterium]